ncbi:MAG: protein GlmU [Desulfobacter sp.]|nr:MAG: protein GlmU [Desulfobacter sp.]
MTQKLLTKLIEKGVKIPNPETVYISRDVDPDRISGNGVTLFSGTKLTGPRTLIADNASIGYEAPATLENTVVGPDTRLHGGYFQDTVCVGRNVFGSNAHVRKGTILEEEANAAHTVGLKQTILFPFVTLGSLINFCDCLMAGGTSRRNHSEVGSSFIHFNYTPNQDKATPSMMGNIHQGVMLNQPPVFMGGQGGLVGPARIGFGCISAAGSIIRKSEERPGRLIMGGALKNGSMPWQTGVYTQPEKILDMNLGYIAGLFALKAWYTHVRPLFKTDFYAGQIIQGLQENLELCIKERISRLTAFGEKLSLSRDILAHKKKGQGALDAHDRVLGILSEAKSRLILEKDFLSPDTTGEVCIRAVENNISRLGKEYIAAIQELPLEASNAGSAWLKSIETAIINRIKQD